MKARVVLAALAEEMSGASARGVGFDSTIRPHQAIANRVPRDAYRDGGDE
ncbi:hypothetical protein MWU77_11990 [Rhodococcus sp. F64268]|nr:hypothetical protein [Rhodococcus sp. F64268]